jgi:hypothetical protein
MTERDISIALLLVCKVAGSDGDFNAVAFHALCDKLKQLGAADEREACAQECEGWTLLPGGYTVTLEEAKQSLVATIAKRIRARGNT